MASTGNTTAVRSGKGGVGGERRADVGEGSAAAESGASDVGAPALAPSEASSDATAASTGPVTASIGAVGGYGCERDRQRSGSGAVAAAGRRGRQPGGRDERGGGGRLAAARARAVRTLSRIACHYARPGTEAELPLPLTAGEDGDPVGLCCACFCGAWSRVLLP